MKAEQRKRRRKFTFWATLVLLMITFGKNVFMLLKSTKLVGGLAKIVGPLVTMLLSVWAYALLAPVEFAVGLVVLLLIHEMGHVWAAKYKGLPVSAPLFIPFLGALITMKRNPRDAETEAFIAMGGPLIGTLGALAFLWYGLAFSSEIMVQLAYLGLLLNLVNLLPIHPLDGGRISVAVSRWLWLIGLIGGFILVVFVLRSPLFFLIWALFAWNLFSKYVLKRKGGVRYRTDNRHLLELGDHPLPDWFYPKEGQQRQLEWTTWSTLDGQQVVEYYWDALEFRGRKELNHQSLIHIVALTDTRHVRNEGQLIALQLEVTLEAQIHESDRYYEVPASVRWGYGATYVALAGLIGFSMIWIQNLII